MEEEQSESELYVAFPIEDVSQDNELFRYVQSVRQQTSQANKKYLPIEENVGLAVKSMAATRAAEATNPLKVLNSTARSKWMSDTSQHFQTVLKNLQYLRDRQAAPARKQIKQSYCQIIKQEPQAQWLMAFQFVEIGRLMDTICIGYRHSKCPRKQLYAVCLWLYSLLAVYRTLGGPAHFELVSDINFIVEKAVSDTRNEDSVEAKAVRILQTILMSEFGQKHLQYSD